MFLIKLGGSVITDKSKKYCFKQEVTDRLSGEIKKSDKDVIIVHGAGSFGHILAKQYKLNEGYKNKDQLQGFSLTHAMVQKLNTLVLKSLHDRNIAAVSIPPHAVLTLDDHKLNTMDYTIFNYYLKKGFTPVAFGDVVLDKKLGFSVCSGDLLIRLLAEQFKPEKVIFVIDEDGLYTANPKMNKNAEFIALTTLQKLETFTTSADAHADVTRGMEGKIDTIKTIAKLGIDTVLLNGNKPDRLYHVLAGEEAKGTIVRGGKI
jgi:isopentenyl phosphate kinase